MSDLSLHPDVVRGILRMRYGTMDKFSQACGLKPYALRDFLRGQSSTAKHAVAKELGVKPDQLTVSKNSTNVEFNSRPSKRRHRQNAEAR
ncbi:helix-turn-helix domain-containing protein [Sphingobium yanoikuyae]|uniref:Helix-turn-helix domain-containing protein n=1 Tax=Sphingobium yanoikuyae TaxID=13690 RepID=A0A9X7UBR4_SPHYA|nr:helix-turn-helix domain-containing protein [Sphingobium yanoikuyae]QNG47386.1 helix-turn-helix domain-containing protein [Sphingobium yanoikuyae]